jgi:hypothetical protein
MSHVYASVRGMRSKQEADSPQRHGDTERKRLRYPESQAADEKTWSLLSFFSVYLCLCGETFFLSLPHRLIA